MSERFAILDTPIADLVAIHRKPIGDSRGFLERLFCTSELAALLKGSSIAQINHTLTARRGTVRGLHFQVRPHAEKKLVSCLRGEVFDVAVDVRRGSKSFLMWHGELLSASNHKTMVIPEGFAHGFQCLTDDCEMLYFHTAPYDGAAERALNVRDPRLAIQWPEPITETSARDASHVFVTDDFLGIDP